MRHFVKEHQGGCVGNAAQTVLYGVNCLMQEYISKIKLPVNKQAVSNMYTMNKQNQSDEICV